MESGVKPAIHQYVLFSVIDIEKFLDSDLPIELKMSLVRKLFRRNKKTAKTEESSPIYATIEETATRRVAPILPERPNDVEVDDVSNMSVGSLDRIVPDGTDIDDMLESEEITKRKQLNNALRKVR